jgi:hypothetical protein
MAALVARVAAAKERAGAEAAAGVLAERAAIRARIRTARAELEQAYADMASLSDSVEGRMAAHPSHLADLRGTNDRPGPLAWWLEARRQLAESFADFCGGLERAGGRAGANSYLAMEFVLPERAVLNAVGAGSSDGRPLFAARRRTAGEHLAALAKLAGEE